MENWIPEQKENKIHFQKRAGSLLIWKTTISAISELPLRLEKL